MPKEQTYLNQLKVENPCHEDWNKMTGNEQQKFCLSCNKHVHNLSKMPQKKAVALLKNTPEICVRYAHDETGDIIFLNQKKWYSSSIYRLKQIAASFIGLLVLTGLPLKGWAENLSPNETNQGDNQNLQYLGGKPSEIIEEPSPYTVQRAIENAAKKIPSKNAPAEPNPGITMGEIAPVNEEEPSIKNPDNNNPKSPKPPYDVKNPERPPELMGRLVAPHKRPK